MEPELKQVLERLDDKITDNNKNVLQRFDQIDRRLDKIELSTGDDHDKIIRLEGGIESLVRDLSEHEIKEEKFDTRIKENEDRVNALEKTLVKYSVIVGVIITGGNQGIEILKSMFGG